MTQLNVTADMYPCATPGVIGTAVDDGAVLVQPEDGTVKVLNEVGARIWQLANGQRSISQIAHLLSAEYAVEQEQAEADTVAFVADLAQRGLMMVLPTPREDT